MTIRSSDTALEQQKWRRALTLCSTFVVTRSDGYVLRFTDHDRVLTIDGLVHLPAQLGSISAERREAALRSGNQEASGTIDGATITIPDLLGHKYRGASVRQRIIDWRRPWIWHYEATKRVRQMAYDGSKWVATLEGITARLQVPIGGFFGGTHSQQCTHALASKKCKADISGDLIYDETATTVDSTGTTSIVIVGTAAAWTIDQWAGHYFHTKSGPTRGQERLVVSNTATALTLKSALSEAPANAVAFWLGQGPRVATVVQSRMEFTVEAADFAAANFVDNYFRDGEIEWITGANAGTVSPIVEYMQGTRTFLLLFPTAKDITVADRGIIRPGCDGLRTTCVAKFRQFPFKVGTTTGVPTTTVIPDATAALTASVYANAGYELRITSGAIAGEQQPITANGTTSYTVSPAFSGAAASGVTYEVVKNNVDNFGGTDTYSPGANRTLEQPT